MSSPSGRRLRTRRLLAPLTATLAVLGLAGVSLPAASAAPWRAAPGNGAVGTTCTNGTVIRHWPIADRVDQLIVVPTEESDVEALAPSSTSVFRYGGVILFGATAPTNLPSQLAALRSRVPHHAGLLVMTDEEGGGIQRMANLVGSMPWAATMGKDWTPQHIQAVAHLVAVHMAADGVNVDLAPVLDVDGRNIPPGPTDPDGWRSFSGNPSVVAADGVAFMKGMMAGGVIPVVKHFPGLGVASGNTDDGPATTLPWPEEQSQALPPFEAAFAAHAPAVMISNAVVPDLTQLPASLSEPLTTSVLKEQMSFHGLVITDSLSAGAISDIGYSVPAASVKAIEAGADMVLFGGGTTALDLSAAASVSAALVQAVDNGGISQTRLDGAVLEVLAAKRANLCTPS